MWIYLILLRFNHLCSAQGKESEIEFRQNHFLLSNDYVRK
jgi:hypothetical protein